MDAAQFEAAGLYDPRAPHAADRLALLEWMAGRGITIEEMVRALREQRLTAVAADLELRPGPRYTAAEIAARLGVSADRLMRLSLAVGVPPATAADAIYNDDDVEMFAQFAGGAAIFGEVGALRFSRTVGSALARIAEAAVSLFQVNVEAPLRAAGDGELQLAQENLRGIQSLRHVEIIMRGLFRVHMEVAIRRLREARPRSSVDSARFAVGFVDLVGFTPLSQAMSSADLAEVVARFEDTAHDVVTERGGRLVKVIGDEVMFVTVDPAVACDVALSMVERFAGDPAVTPRGGLALGDVVVRGGDYYGPIVNLASRVAELAVPQELLVTAPLVEAAAGGGFHFEPAGKRLLKGFAEPVALASLERSAVRGR